MNKSKLKEFAINARNTLMEQVKFKIEYYKPLEEFSYSKIADTVVLEKEGYKLELTQNEYESRKSLIERVKEKGLDNVIEEAAYTWFNRLVAIRYMEVNDFLPLGKDNESLDIRVLSNRNSGAVDPEIIEYKNLYNSFLDLDLDNKVLDEYSGDYQKAYPYVLQRVCRKLGKVIPQIFDGITDYIDILIPNNLLNKDSIVRQLADGELITEDDWKEQVEIIGWLYQYYNQSEKDRVISAKKAYKKNEIPYATQLFTPDWIVKYMVENSLGRYWIEHGGNTNLIENWKYYIKDENMEIKDRVDPKQISCIDPCCGSGHILVYMFDVLYQIYESVGYNKLDIPELILKNNLYGLDIDDRAGQLSILAVLLKARKYDKNIFNKNIARDLNVLSIQEIGNVGELAKQNISDETCKEYIRYLENDFNNAKEIGSLLIVSERDYTKLIETIENENYFLGSELKRLLPLIKQANILSKKYEIVVTNPPYFKNSLMQEVLKNYIEKFYKNYKNDIFCAFIKRTIDLTKNTGYIGLMTPNVWQFISSYEELRRILINNYNLNSLIQLAKGAFFKEATVDISSFVLKKSNCEFYGRYIGLEKYKGDMIQQEVGFLTEKNKALIISQQEFLKIPSCQIAFWLKNFNIFKFDKINKLYESGGRNKTHDNNKYVRKWWEVSDQIKWQNYANGGDYRKWYGNHIDVVDWSENAKRNYASHGGLYNQKYANKVGVCWNLITSATNGFRIKNESFHYSSGSPTIFPVSEDFNLFLLAFLNSSVSHYLLNVINPTLNTTVNDVLNLPLNFVRNLDIDKIVNCNIQISKCDWDAFETSEDYKRHPLVKWKVPTPNYIDEKPKYEIKIAYKEYENNVNAEFGLLKSNEEELNRIFIDMYGLQDELTPEVEDKDITIRKADKLREIKSLISYAVGCMFGRYSLDEEGLIYAGGKFDANKYKTFKADIDNVIPITDETYFEDDIVSRFKNFIEIVYGRETLNENLEFIAETLGKKGIETSEETIRRYFNDEFFNDHCKIYQKRPIYWQFDSGKANGFKCLVYMHRYQPDLVAKIRMNYLHKIQKKYETLMDGIDIRIDTTTSMSDKKNLEKKKEKYTKQLAETRKYDEKIKHLADQNISIDLDDGVVVNYAKFQDVLGKIK